MGIHRLKRDDHQSGINLRSEAFHLIPPHALRIVILFFSRLSALQQQTNGRILDVADSFYDLEKSFSILALEERSRCFYSLRHRFFSVVRISIVSSDDFPQY